MKMTQRKTKSIWPAVLALFAACGTATETPIDRTADAGNTTIGVSGGASPFTVEPVGLKLQVDQAGAAAAPRFVPMGDTSGALTGTVTVTSAFLNLRRVEFKLPEGMNCEGYDKTIRQAEKEDSGEGVDKEKEHDGAATGSTDGEAKQNADGAADDGTDQKTVDNGDAPAAAPAAVTDEQLVERPATDVEGGRGGKARKGLCLGEKFRFEGPFHVSLTDGVSNPPLENLAVPPGTYRRVKMKIDDVEKSYHDSRVAGRSLVINGVYSDASTTFPVYIGLKFDEELEFEAPGGITIGTGGGEDFVVKFPVQEWLGAIDLAACEAQAPVPGDTLVIDEEGDNECGGVEDNLKEGFKRVGKVEKEKKDKKKEEEHDH